jgi:hypothetical protein
MTIQEAIAKAIEGGYPKQRVEDLALHVQAEYFLETTFWEALVRVLGVEGDFEYIHLERGEPRKLRHFAHTPLHMGVVKSPLCNCCSGGCTPEGTVAQ